MNKNLQNIRGKMYFLTKIKKNKFLLFFLKNTIIIQKGFVFYSKPKMIVCKKKQNPIDPEKKKLFFILFSQNSEGKKNHRK
jgi:hypothetical protein